MGATAGTGFMSRASRAPGSVPSHVYRPTYQSDPYSSQRAGLDLTPQASMYSPNYFAMPTYTRPSAPTMPVQSTGGLFGRAPQPAYSIPYRTASSSDLPRGFGSRLSGIFGTRKLSPEQQSANLIRDYRGSNLTEGMYDRMMQNPAVYLDYLQRVEAGENPTSIGYAAPPPIRYMTAAQQQAYNQNVANQLESMIAPRTTFDMSDSSSDGA